MMINEELHLVLAMLSRAVDLPGPAPSVRSRPSGASEPWRSFAALVTEHQLDVFFGGRLELMRDHALPRALIETFTAAHIRNAHESLFRHAELARITDRLGERTPLIALKGAALSQVLYPEMADRAMSDLDLLLVDPQQLTTARVLLLSDGYRSSGDDKIGHHHAAPLHDAIAELTIELHTNLARPPLPEHALREIISRRVKSPAIDGLYVLDPIARVAHHALHAVNDPIDSPLLRNIFELAWMTMSLDRGQQLDLARLLERWSIASRAAPAFSLASELFGAPQIAQRPPSAIDHIAKMRLGWTESRALERDRWSKFRRDVAERTVARGDSGDRVAAPLLAAGLESAGRAARTKIRGLLRIEGELVPTPLETTQVGSGLLAHDRDTGKVHFLPAINAAIWCALEEEHDPDRLEALLEKEDGVPPEVTRAAIRELLESGLARPRSEL